MRRSAGGGGGGVGRTGPYTPRGFVLSLPSLSYPSSLASPFFFTLFRGRCEGCRATQRGEFRPCGRGGVAAARARRCWRDECVCLLAQRSGKEFQRPFLGQENKHTEGPTLSFAVRIERPLFGSLVERPGGCPARLNQGSGLTAPRLDTSTPNLDTDSTPRHPMPTRPTRHPSTPLDTARHRSTPLDTARHL